MSSRNKSSADASSFKVHRTDAPEAPKPAMAKASINLRMHVDAITQLKAHSLGEGRSASQIVEELIRANLKTHRLVDDSRKDA